LAKWWLNEYVLNFISLLSPVRTGTAFMNFDLKMPLAQKRLFAARMSGIIPNGRQPRIGHCTKPYIPAVIIRWQIQYSVTQ